MHFCPLLLIKLLLLLYSFFNIIIADYDWIINYCTKVITRAKTSHNKKNTFCSSYKIDKWLHELFKCTCINFVLVQSESCVVGMDRWIHLLASSMAGFPLSLFKKRGGCWRVDQDVINWNGCGWLASMNMVICQPPHPNQFASLN